MTDDMGTRGMNGSAGDRRTTQKDWRVWSIGLLFAVVLISLGTSCQATRAVKVARQTELRDRDTSRATAYRLCSRNAVDRAFAHSRVRAVGGLKAEEILESPLVLPILDCRPNLEGFGAKPLPPKKQREFVDRWEHHELSGVERGICPDTPIGAVRVKEC